MNISIIIFNCGLLSSRVTIVVAVSTASLCSIAALRKFMLSRCEKLQLVKRTIYELPVTIGGANCNSGSAALIGRHGNWPWSMT